MASGKTDNDGADETWVRDKHHNCHHNTLQILDVTITCSLLGTPGADTMPWCSSWSQFTSVLLLVGSKESVVVTKTVMYCKW